MTPVPLAWSKDADVPNSRTPTKSQDRPASLGGSSNNNLAGKRR